MAIISFNTGTTGLVGKTINPRRCTMITTEDLATITTPGYLNNQNSSGDPIFPTDMFDVLYDFNESTQSGTYGIFKTSYSSSTGFTLSLYVPIVPPPPLVRDFSINIDTPTPGVFFAVNANLTDIQVINQANAFIAAFNGRTFIEGSDLADAIVGLRGGIFANGGTYTPSSGTIAAVYGSLNFEALSGTTTNNGGNIYAIYGLYEKRFDISTDPSNFSIIGAENETTDSVGQMYFSNGRANYFMKIVDSGGTHTASAGTAAGQAGDPTRCNAQRAIKIRLNGSDGYIGVFNTN